MRKTRPQDYDPNFKQTKAPQAEELDMEDVVPMKERSPIVAARQSESPSDPRPGLPKSPEPPVRPEPPERSERDQRPVRPQKRQMKRHSFDIYIDQLEALRSLKLEAMRRGEERGLSKMIREALDAYLKSEK